MTTSPAPILNMSPFVVASSENLTPDEIRNLLFNVDCSLEIPIDDFNENWWPLITNIWTKWTSYKHVNGDVWKVFACCLMKFWESSTRQKENVPSDKRRITKKRSSDLCYAKIKVSWLVSLKIVQIERCKNSPNHAHLLLECDRIKRPQVIRTLVEKEAIKNYTPPAIASAVREYATKELGLGTSVSELKRQEVANIKYKICGPMEKIFIGDSNLMLDISQCMSYLIEKEYKVERYSTHQSSKGIVFAHPEQIKKLEQYGWLTLIDSTHKTNRYDWHLFTLYIRDTYGCWDVGAHFFVSNESCETVSQALKIIRDNYCHWSPRYILSDQSSIEAKSIKKAFPGINGGEQECEVILCVVHIMRTKIGCEKLIQEAIDNCAVSSIQNYIKRNYMKNTERWALWARQHSPLLLQVTSTNPLESYHSEIKRLTSSKHGLVSAVQNIVNIDLKKRSDSEKVAFDFRTKKISAHGVEDDIIEEIHKFPFPLQRLIVKEACAHIFYEHMYGNTKLLTADVWKMFQEMFEESGFEVYESRESVITFVQTEKQKDIENRRLTVAELTERVRDRYWRVEEMGNVRRTEAYISMLESSINPIISQFENK
ncbi:hypothetical protein RhiirA1_472440 [Rhizophagus irregularis]|uniref:ZSWIM1/3 RNaseH-like domain-containing protein n=1 Tax=Rhizophagus irregularis TaxID=588596 RepID=A0A2N0R2E8_9GLOM|nr:hypothetical protein RhiirA1_472440 [Rhizophagus irregularis]